MRRSCDHSMGCLGYPDLLHSHNCCRIFWNVTSGTRMCTVQIFELILYEMQSSCFMSESGSRGDNMSHRIYSGRCMTAYGS